MSYGNFPVLEAAGDLYSKLNNGHNLTSVCIQRKTQYTPSTDIYFKTSDYLFLSLTQPESNPTLHPITRPQVDRP
jgi:hypothetical protein